jgi:VIT1/CCC1 family predicted Fe2+/Mn2+ transporter
LPHATGFGRERCVYASREANDGIVSTASLIVGVAAAATQNSVLIAGVAGLGASATCGQN